MRESPLFSSPEQAITVTFHAVSGLVVVTAWLALTCVHLLLGLILLLLLWWFHITPAQVESAFQTMLASNTLSAAGLLGVSAASVCTAYILLIRWVWGRTFVPWMGQFLLRDAKQR